MESTAIQMAERLEGEILELRRRIEPSRHTVQAGERQIRRMERAILALRGHDEPQPDLIASEIEVTTGEVVRYLSQQDAPVAIRNIRDALSVKPEHHAKFGKFILALVECGLIQRDGTGRSTRYMSI